MKRSGFTMIELIFVIVILGILASVAIPKLAATRDDAKVSKVLNELSTLKSDMSAYFTSHGNYDTGANKIQDMTNVTLYDGTSCSTKSTQIQSGKTYSYCIRDNSGTLRPLVNITVSNTKGSLTFQQRTITNSNVRTALIQIDAFKQLTGKDTSHPVVVENGGSRVTY